MGLANLVPGISGGTMLLASGVYPSFVDGIASLTRFRFSSWGIIRLILIIVPALAAFLLLAGPVVHLVIHHRWVMFSLFIGLALGGVPLVWNLLKPVKPDIAPGVVIGLVVMGMMAMTKHQVGADGPQQGAFVLLLVAGASGGAAMVLPGISGSYLLLILGQYVAILMAIKASVSALRNGELEALSSAMGTLVPFGIGVLVGVVGLSNLVSFCLRRHRRITLSVLLGLLLGAVLGLWPFQESIAPQIGDVIKGVQLQTQADVDAVDPMDQASRIVSPSFLQALGSLGLAMIGLFISMGISRLGSPRKEPEP